MKTIISLIVLLGFNAFAQNRYVADGALGGNKTFTCGATLGTNVGYTISCDSQPSVLIQIELQADASGAYTFRLPLQYSVDGSVYDNKQVRSIDISFNGVTKQVITTNVPTYGCSSMYIPYLTNLTAAINITNGVLKVPLNWKSPAP
jgi:hypothetical protein